MKHPNSVLITGAGRGMGTELAKAYSRPGAHVFLCDLGKEGLEHACAECEKLGGEAHGSVVDVTDAAAMERWILAADDSRPLDLVIVNAAISHGNMRKEETAEEVRSVFAVNIDGMLNSVLPILPRFRARGRGQIALMSSLAGLRGFPHAPSYSASKAAVRIFGQGLRARLQREGVVVSVVIPAFVKTPMTAGNLYHMPFVLEADRAAQIIRKKLAKGKSEFVFPRPYDAVAWGLRAFPPALWAFFTRVK